MRLILIFSFVFFAGVVLSRLAQAQGMNVGRASRIYFDMLESEKKMISVPVLENSRQVFMARMTEDYKVSVDDFRIWAAGNMDAESQGFMARMSGNVQLSAMSAAGIALEFDEAEAVLRLTADPARRRKSSLSMRAPPVRAEEEMVAPAVFSSFVNLRGGQEFSSGGNNDGRRPLRLDMDGALNFKGWVLEGRGDYLEDDARAFQRGELRLVRDLPDKMVRIAAGDLSYPVAGFQSYQPMLGVSVARNFTLQPYRVTAPTGETSFTLRTPSRVDIFVNGNKVRALKLEPGAYDVSDFPVADGGNDVTLVITDATGNVEKKVFPLLSDRALLKKGLHEYAYNAGIASENMSRKTEYDGSDPAFSFFHRYGVTDVFTTGAAAQGNEDAQQASFSLLHAFSFGTLGAEAAASHAEKAGAAARLSFGNTDSRQRRDFSAEVVWRSMGFSAIGQADAVNRNALETAARYNRVIFDAVNAGIGGRYRFGRAGMDDDWAYSASASKSFLGGYSVSLSAEHRRQEGAGIFIALTWSPPLSRHSLSTSVDTLAGTQDAQWNYRAARDVRDFYASAGVTRENRGRQYAMGGIGYAGYRGEASFRHDVTTYDSAGMGTEQTSRVLFGTAIVHADGKTALSRPVTGGFVMIERDASIRDRSVGVNPAQGSSVKDDVTHQTEANAFGPAVIQNVTPYMFRTVRIDTRNMPPAYDIGRDVFTVMPSYKSGSVITVGNPDNIMADGYLKDSAGLPLAMVGGEIKNVLDGAMAQEFFTNAEGRFRIGRLRPGKYKLSIYRHEGLTAEIKIPDMRMGRFDAGIVSLAGVKP